jgi:molybdopterin-containing oxidoreductase family membrane subunit
VAGAIFGGFAMVLTIMLPARAIYPQLHDMITPSHIDKMTKVILLTGSIVGYAYLMELFIAWYGTNPYERAAFWYRAFGPYWWAYASMMFCNVISPQLFWFKWCRSNIYVVFIVCMFINAGMWFERFVIIATTLARDFLPSSWGLFHPTIVDILTFIGTFGLFTTLFLLFVRFLPMICMFEVKAVLPEANPHYGEEAH